VRAILDLGLNSERADFLNAMIVLFTTESERGRLQHFSSPETRLSAPLSMAKEIVVATAFIACFGRREFHHRVLDPGYGIIRCRKSIEHF